MHYPHHERALLLVTLGSLLAEQTDYKQAEACFRQALELHERDPLTHYHFLPSASYCAPAAMTRLASICAAPWSQTRANPATISASSGL